MNGGGGGEGEGGLGHHGRACAGVPRGKTEEAEVIVAFLDLGSKKKCGKKIKRREIGA